MEEPRVFPRHLRQARLCSRGAREWFKLHDLSFHDFTTIGIPVSAAEATGDAFAITLAELARKEASDGR